VIPMTRHGRRRRIRAAPAIAALVLLALRSSPAAAQVPVVVPGAYRPNLQSGVRMEAKAPAETGSSDALPEAAADTDFGATGDWLGARDALFDDGIDLHANFSQFYQGVAAGGLRQASSYGIKFDYFGTVDGEKLLGWRGLFINLHGESRFGRSVNRDVGSLVPANFAMEFPRPYGSATALTNMQIEQFVGSNLVFTFGKLNAADGVNIHPFLGGNGINRFLNEAFVLSPIYGRLLPYSTPGAGFSYLRDMDPIFTLLVLDSSGRPDTSGLDRMFRNGATIFTHLRVPVTPFGLPGHQSVETAYASGRFSPLSEDDYLILPPAIPAHRRTGSWVVTYGFDQFLMLDDGDSSKGWGLFGNISLADGDANPIRWFMNLGAGGESPLPGRGSDSWGAGYFYLGTSRALRQLLGPEAPGSHEQGFEFYYNAAIADSFTLTADVQAVEPAGFDARSALLFGLRARIDF
jgi:porin